MPIFRLWPAPDYSDHQDWSRSRYKGECRVNAASSTEARAIARLEFGFKEAKGDVTSDPWEQEDLVLCIEVDDAGHDLPHGAVKVPP